jgi:hypothetical protein
MLTPGDIRRSIADPVKALAHFADLFSVSEFLECCSVSVSELERAWSRKTAQTPNAQAKEAFRKLTDGLITEKRTAPSLRTTN